MAKNGPLQHVYLTAHGAWEDNTPWAGEIAQIGIRLAFAPAVGAPDPGSTFTLSEGGDIGNVFAVADGTHGQLTQSWTADAGVPTLGVPITAERQIDFAEDMWTFLDSIKAYTGSGFSWTHMKIAPVQADGGYGADASVYTLTTPLSGTASNTATQPPQTSVCLSIMAPVIGRRGRGRMYMPAIGGAVLTTHGLVSPTYRQALLDAGKVLIESLQNFPGAPADWFPLVVVTSAGKTTGIRPTELRVGSQFDTQQRRENAVSESYMSESLIPVE